jgi:Na+-transporting methylmalonyl-CoA/oxaloacetate decarboxylase gamma subunit
MFSLNVRNRRVCVRITDILRSEQTRHYGANVMNWGQALLIAGKGFGTVFLILIILAVVTWLIGLAFRRTGRGQAKAEAETEAEQTRAKD